MLSALFVLALVATVCDPAGNADDDDGEGSAGSTAADVVSTDMEPKFEQHPGRFGFEAAAGTAGTEAPLLVLGGGPGEVLVEPSLTTPQLHQVFAAGRTTMVIDQRGVGSGAVRSVVLSSPVDARANRAEGVPAGFARSLDLVASACAEDDICTEQVGDLRGAIHQTVQRFRSSLRRSPFSRRAARRPPSLHAVTVPRRPVHPLLPGCVDRDAPHRRRPGT